VDSLLSSSVGLAFIVIPIQMWSYLVFGLVLAIGLVAIFVRGDWQKAGGLDKLLLFGPLFYAAPLGGFGTEHFTISKIIASMIPTWMPWHVFWAYFIGACFIAAALSIVTRIQARVAATLVALTFFLFVVLMDIPGWLQDIRNRFSLALALRELSFSAGALAFASSVGPQSPGARVFARVARYFIAIAVLVYSFEQFRHGNYVPAIPLDRLTPDYAWGHAIWTYVAAVVFAVAGILLLLGKKMRAAATWIALAVLLAEVFVYVPIAVVDRGSLVGFNYMADTLMFGGAILLLAGAMPREP
jgi:hypothetical protein